MDVLEKIQQKTEKYTLLKEKIVEINAKTTEIRDAANAEITALNKQIEGIVTEMNRLQGEYRVLVELGQEEGLLDEEGKPVLQAE